MAVSCVNYSLIDEKALDPFLETHYKAFPAVAESAQIPAGDRPIAATTVFLALGAIC